MYVGPIKLVGFSIPLLTHTCTMKFTLFIQGLIQAKFGILSLLLYRIKILKMSSLTKLKFIKTILSKILSYENVPFIYVYIYILIKIFCIHQFCFSGTFSLLVIKFSDFLNELLYNNYFLIKMNKNFTKLFLFFTKMAPKGKT